MDIAESSINQLIVSKIPGPKLAFLLGSFVLFSLETRRYKYLKEVLLKIYKERIYMERDFMLVSQLIFKTINFKKPNMGQKIVLEFFLKERVFDKFC